MTKNMKIAAGAAAFALLIAGATMAYNTLRDSVTPKFILAEQSANISAPQGEPGASGEQAEPSRMKAPDFSVEDADGNTVKLSDLEGKPVVLNFWASWCPPCRAEMPDFDKAYAEFGEDVAFLMINMTDGQRETKEKGAAYVFEQGFSFPVHYDTKQEAAHAYGIRSIPSTILIDSDGYIVTGAEGQIDGDMLWYGISMIQNEKDEAEDSEMTTVYRKISTGEAYEMMAEADGSIVLDVRTDEEYRERHIPGAVLIPDFEVSARAKAELPDKDAPILIYCRSGRRSAITAAELAGMGYTNVYDFGGIIDWPYETE